MLKALKTRQAYGTFLAIAGALALAACSGHWNPGTPPDTTDPTVTFTDPANSAVGVAINKKISATFSEAMAPATISGATFRVRRPDNTVVPGTVSYVGVTATYSPTDNLAVGTTYTALITTGATDPGGNALAADYTWRFTTGAAADNTAPTVTLTDPADTATGVVLNKRIAATFSEGMDPLTILDTTFTVRRPDNTAVAGAVTLAGLVATFTPAAPLAPLTAYTGTITTGARDLAGNALAANKVWRFTTGAAADVTRPTVTRTVPDNLATGVAINTKVSATFSEGMDPLTVTNANFTLKRPDNTAVPGTVALVGLIGTFTPTDNLAVSTTYTAAVSTGASDLAGNALLANYVWRFTTGAAADNVAPRVILANPADLADNVALNTAVNATFSEAMDPLTVSTASFTLQETGPPLGPLVIGTVSYDLLTRIATFTPSANLAPSTRYTATVTTGAADLAGNPLAVDNVWTFTTGNGLAPGAVNLGSAAGFGIMATSAITNTGFSTVNGDVSLDPGTSMTGFPPGIVNGAVHVNDTVSAQARIDLLVAYNFAKTLPVGTIITGGADLGALYPGGIPPGTYTSDSTMLVSTPLVLDAGGNANAVWVFQIGSSLTTGASVSLANGAQAKNVFWVPTSDATIGVGTIFHGTIVSGRDVTAVTGATINGRILAGAITAGTIALQTATVNVPAP
jgi:hypothetical protein